jgi:nucleoside-diphosphate-sugar epimerase
VILPLVAIATPATYVREPLRVFELDFEANLPIVRACVKHRKRVVCSRRPPRSTACAQTTSSTRSPPTLVLGPINKPRWIYACAKQLMDRVIHAYGMQEGLDYTLFRPFNWIGRASTRSTRQRGQLAGDHAVPRPHRARRTDQAGRRRRTEARLHLCHDGIDALMKIIENPNGVASGKHLQHRQPEEQLFGARARHDDAGAGRAVPRVRATTPPR